MPNTVVIEKGGFCGQSVGTLDITRSSAYRNDQDKIMQLFCFATVHWIIFATLCVASVASPQPRDWVQSETRF
ncbi:MAG: hypothetical protein HKN47_12610 [Pirellulaceae bacterium]|nr:hypothetical protein [Pirellulaceae bacterium]